MRTFTEMHGGTVTVESEGAGKGTVFTVRLPMASTTAAEPGPARPPSAPRHDSRRILVADDNRDAAETLAAFLRLSGYDVRIALDGQSALRSVEEFMPDAAFLDIGMPGISGYEVARHVRSLAFGKTIRLVALTVWGAAQDKQRAADSGFDHHLTKPARLEDIEAILALDMNAEPGYRDGTG